MLRATVIFISIVGVTSVCADVWALQAPPEGAHANSAASIPPINEPADSITTNAEQEHTDEEFLVDQKDDEATNSSVEKPLLPIPVIETRSLGLPTAEASPSQDVEQNQSELKEPWLNRLDPRKNELTRVGGALAVVLGLLVMMRGILKRGTGALRGGGRPSGVLEILARFPIGRGQQLILLKLARRVILVHQAGTVMTTISEVAEPNEVASLLARIEAGSSKKNSNLFRAALNQCDVQYDSPSRRERRLLTARSGQPEIIDLTRSGSRSGSGLIEQRKVTA